MRQHGGRDERGVADADAVVRLVRLLQPAQDGDGVRHRRLADEDRLEAPLERGVLLDVLAVLVERRRADAAQFPARQHWLEHVRRVDRAFGGACADDRVQLVDEEDEVALGVANLGEDGLQPLLELAAVLRAGEERADVERPHPLALQPFGDVAVDDALCEPLDDGGLAPLPGSPISFRGCSSCGAESTWMTRQISSSRPMTGSSLPCSAASVRSRPNFRQRLVGALRILRRNALSAAHRLDLRLELLAGHDVERKEQLLRRHVVVLHALRLVQGLVEDTGELRRHGRLLLGALDARLRAPSVASACARSASASGTSSRGSSWSRSASSRCSG